MSMTETEPAEPPETRLDDGEGLEIATEADFGIVYDDEGELKPVKQRIPGTEKAIRCRPLPSGALERYEDVLESGQAEDARVAELFNEFIIEGPGSDADEAWVREVCPGYLVSGLVQALKNSSGYDVFRAVQQIQNEEARRNLELLQTLGTEEITELAESLGSEPASSSDSTS